MFVACGIMTALFPPWALAAACVLIIPGLLASSNAALLATSLLVLPVAVWLLGGAQTYRVLLWVIALNWLQVIADVASADLTGNVISNEYRVEAIVFSLCAILALALGMRWGAQLGDRMFRSPAQIDSGLPDRNEGVASIKLVTIGYFISLLVTWILRSVATSVPGLTQPLLALNLIKFVFVYLVAAKVFESGRGYVWLALVSIVGNGHRASGILFRLQGSVHRHVDRPSVEPAPGKRPNVDFQRNWPSSQ